MTRDEINQAIVDKFEIKRYNKILPPMLPWNAGRKHTRFTLAQLLGELGYTKGAEIGVRRGNYSKYLIKCMPHLELYCIDPWAAYERYSQERQDRIYGQCLEKLKDTPNAKIIRKSSMDALKDFEDESLDFIFIDGDHRFDAIMMDIICWVPKIRKNGIIIIHDYYATGFYGVRQAVDAYTQCHNINPWFTTKEFEPTAFWVKS